METKLTIHETYDPDTFWSVFTEDCQKIEDSEVKDLAKRFLTLNPAASITAPKAVAGRFLAWCETLPDYKCGYERAVEVEVV